MESLRSRAWSRPGTSVERDRHLHAGYLDGEQQAERSRRPAHRERKRSGVFDCCGRGTECPDSASSSKDKIAPRAGFAYDVNGDGMNKVYGSWGIFYDIFKLNLPRGSFGGDKWMSYYYTLDTPELPETVRRQYGVPADRARARPFLEVSTSAPCRRRGSTSRSRASSSRCARRSCRSASRPSAWSVKVDIGVSFVHKRSIAD